MLSRLDIDEHINYARKSLRRQVGDELVPYLLYANGSVTLRMVERSQEIYGDGYFLGKALELSIITDIYPVAVREMVIAPPLPPFEFISLGPTGEKPVIEWQCSFCGMVNLVEEHLECRKCGGPRKVMR